MVIMAKLLTLLVIIVKVLLSNGQEKFIGDSKYDHHTKDNSKYLYGYGVTEGSTGDIKTVWESKNGDTVKGHYSIIEPDGSMRSVEYASGPEIGFSSPVHKDALQDQQVEEEYIMKNKALREYDRNYDFSEDADIERPYKSIDRKRKRQPYDSFKDYSMLKRPKFPNDMEPSEYTHSFSIKHLRDDLNAEPTSGLSHVGVNFDPNCITKNKRQKIKNYNNVADLDFRKQKYPPIISDPYSNDYDKYVGDASNIELEKLIHFYKGKDQYKTYNIDESDSWASIKNNYPGKSENHNLEDSYPEYLPLRPKKKHTPLKDQQIYDSEDLGDYILVPKKKFKNPTRTIEQYHPEADEEFDATFEDERFYKPPRVHTEIIKKVVKKTKPGINILDIFDI